MLPGSIITGNLNASEHIALLNLERKPKNIFDFILLYSIYAMLTKANHPVVLRANTLRNYKFSTALSMIVANFAINKMK